MPPVSSLLLAVLPTLVPARGLASAALVSNSETETAISGYIGDDSERRTVDIDWAGITSIEWQENTDRPCYMEISGKDPEDSAATNISATGPCTQTASHLSRRTVLFEGSPRYFVRGIAVCTNDNADHRLKGIKIIAAKLPTNNYDVVELTVSDKATHLNCDDWHPTVYCPEGQVANGINVEAEDWAYVGLGLRCRDRA